MSHPLIQLVRAELADAVIGSYELGNLERNSETAGNDPTVLVSRERLIDVMTFLRDDDRCQMNMLVMVTAVDYWDFPLHLRSAATPIDEGNAAGIDANNPPRFETVYELMSLSLRHRLRIKVPLTEDDPKVPTLCGLWKAANWGEREAFDMYGIQFEGHPDLRRILMYDEFVGHPLRRDYDLRGYQPLIDMPHLAEYEDHARDR